MSKTTKALTEFHRADVHKILEECEAALKPIAEKYGLVLDRKGKTYRSNALPVMYQFLIKQVDQAGNVMSAKEKDFMQHARLFGLKPEMFGQTFKSRGEEFRITGLAPRSTRYPILADRVRDGKGFKFPAATVKAYLEMQAA